VISKKSAGITMVARSLNRILGCTLALAVAWLAATSFDIKSTAHGQDRSLSGGEPGSFDVLQRKANADGGAKPLFASWPGEALTSAAALDGITSADLRRHVSALADDTFEGREAGSRGGRAAAGYLQMQLKSYGLKPAGEGGGYFQQFNGNCRNILAIIEGTDPALKNEVILVSAHYDHVGYGNARNSYGPTGYIHNGADDNASGASTLLEVAQACAQLEPKPKRSILFALWDAEESGLNGSKHWLSKPTMKLSDVRLMINMDMVGRLRNNKLTVYGARTARGLRKLVSLPNGGEPMTIDFDWQIRSDSDHHPFYMRGIPILMLHTGLHGDYHRPSDDVEKLNVDGMQRVARLLFGLTVEVANLPELPKFRDAVRRESTWTQQTVERVQAPPPGRLGLHWDREDKAAPGLKVLQVVPGGPAAQAGLRTGDRLLSFAGQELAADTDLAGIVLAAQNPVQAVVARQGAEQPIPLTVQLRGQPTKLGIVWREEEAEPGSVMLISIVPGSPAARAGLRPLDRVYAVNGQAFNSGDDLRQLLAAATVPYELSVERVGQVRAAKIVPLPGAAPVPADKPQ
jgi:hypothetical protein